MSTHVYPSLRYRDAKAAIELLQEGFGFELVVAHESEDGSIYCCAHCARHSGENDLKDRAS